MKEGELVPDILFILVAVAAIIFIVKIAFKALKLVLMLGIVVILLYYLSTYGFLNGFF